MVKLLSCFLAVFLNNVYNETSLAIYVIGLAASF